MIGVTTGRRVRQRASTRLGRVRPWAAVFAREWRDDRVTGLAAEIAFYGVLSLLPAFLVIAAGLGSLEWLIGGGAARRAENELLDLLHRVLTDEASGTVAAVESLFTSRRPGVVTFSAIAALWALSRAFSGIIDALDVVYDLDERRPWLRRRALSLGLAVGSAAMVTLVLAAFVVGPLLGSGREVADALGFGGAFATAWNWLRWPVVGVALVAWAATLYHFAPNQRTAWRAELPGALTATAAWIAASVGLSSYLAVAGSANAVLGALGGALIALVWLYALAIGLLIGGEVNAMLAAARSCESSRRTCAW